MIDTLGLTALYIMALVLTSPLTYVIIAVGSAFLIGRWSARSAR